MPRGQPKVQRDPRRSLVEQDARRRRELAKEKAARWYRFIEDQIRERWPEPIYDPAGNQLAVNTATVEAILGTEEFCRRRDAEIANAPKEQPTVAGRPHFSAPEPPRLTIQRPTP